MAYIIASYTSLTGTFGTENIPAGYVVDYNYLGGNQIAIVMGSVDTDGDGITDDYENANGLNPNDPSDAASDPDGDGTTALQEARFGTLENNAASRFRICLTGADFSGDAPVGGDEIEGEYGPLVDGLTYQLTSSSTSDGVFLPLGAPVLGSSNPGGQATFSEATQSTGDTFYRVEVTGFNDPAP